MQRVCIHNADMGSQDWSPDCIQSLFSKVSTPAGSIFSLEQHVSSAPFSSLCYRFIMGCCTRAMTCSHKISSAAEIKQRWWEWRWDASKNSQTFRGSSFHALSAFIFTFMWSHVEAPWRLPVDQTYKILLYLTLYYLNHFILQLYNLVDYEQDVISWQISFHFLFTFIRSISVLILFFSFSVQSISLLYGQPLLLLPPLHLSHLPPPPFSSTSCPPSTTLTSLPREQSTTLVSGASVKACHRNNLTATAPIPSLVCPLSLAFIFWLCFIFSCICRSFLCLPTIFQILLRSLMITFFMTFH